METSSLCRTAVNHLCLGQLEGFRALMVSLRAREPDLARSMLETIVGLGGRIGPSPIPPAVLGFVCALELGPTPQAHQLRLRAEFLLYLHMLGDHPLMSELALSPSSLGEEDMLAPLRETILRNSHLFDVLCANIVAQLEEEEEDANNVLRVILKCVQIVHLDAMTQSLENQDVSGASSHLRFLHFNHGLEEHHYRYLS